MTVKRQTALVAMGWVRIVPQALTWLRATLGPVLIVLAIYWPSRFAFAACLTAAFLSDIFDGIIARAIGVSTPNLRRLDSIADSIFYFCALWAVWKLYPMVIMENLPILIVLFLLECARYALDIWKFRREASYHMWSSKAWGIALFCGFFSVLVFGIGGAPVVAAIVIGILADVEGLSISLTLKSWHHDVPTIVHALRIRARETVT